jgi:hypothetical protein
VKEEEAPADGEGEGLVDFQRPAWGMKAALTELSGACESLG